ncbi:hypothetical protein [Bradyrhizobium neotropicale]|uniref:hypothetical protein n=1 Tax=Bradyrhizobium neotropicale TaxID=1497615 RepID=UPI001AD64C7B|nr:hypothetical protein [Bradyrhizobium neotropicale]MBO4223474.1 hypothetical protein [Bradyrhizobium neotropicale]
MRSVVRIAGLSCVVGLSSCVPWLADIPTVDDQLIVARVNACSGPGDGPIAANNYMQIGFANVYAACEVFFNATKFQQNALATNQTLDAGLIGATSIANATMSTASALKAITITTAGVVFGKSILNDYVTIYTFGTHLYKVRQLVQNDMDNFAAGAAGPANTCIAYANVQRLATKCTIANMQALLDSQVAIPSQVFTPAASTMIAPAMVRPTRVRALASQSSPPMSSTVVPVAPR